jgi:hypothetical protein
MCPSRHDARSGSRVVNNKCEDRGIIFQAEYQTNWKVTKGRLDLTWAA